MFLTFGSLRRDLDEKDLLNTDTVGAFHCGLHREIMGFIATSKLFVVLP